MIAVLRVVGMSIVMLALLLTVQGPLAMAAPSSMTSSMIGCFRSVERTAGLHDGLASVVVARYVNAARHARDWRSPSVVVEMQPSHPPTVHAAENDVTWFDGTFSGGTKTLDFVATDRFTPESLAWIEARVGHPDRVFTCPMPRDMVEGGKATFDIWVFDHAASRQKLAELVTRDTMNGAFSPGRRSKVLPIDPQWGMARIGELGTESSSKPMFLPSGRYRATARFSVGAPCAAELVVVLSGKPLAHAVAAASSHAASVEFALENRGGATSGEFLTLVMPSGEVASADVEQLEAKGVDVLRLFR